MRFRKQQADKPLSVSELFDQTSFYGAFLHDLRRATKEVIIESPFITISRTKQLSPTFEALLSGGVRVIINTRNPEEHLEPYRTAAYKIIAHLQGLGAIVLYTGGHHRKLAIVDDEILWEGSLNILSQYDSCEVMRRIVSPIEVEKMRSFIGINKFLT